MDKNINKTEKNSIFNQIQHNMIENISQKSEEHFKKIPIEKKQEKIGDYILGETIGEGAFAKVKLAYHTPTNEKVAIKIINKEKIDINKINKEIKILQRIKHINIIQIYEIIETDFYFYIVMEYCENKDLFFLIKTKHNLSELDSCKYFQQIINALEHIHLSYITHRDLKPENILLTDNYQRIVITDFGLSKLSDEYNKELSTLCGTLSYSAPEILKGKKYNGVFSDIWSCGVILYVMLVGNLPWEEKESELIYDNIITHSFYYPENLSSDAIDLIEHMLKITPNERYNFDEIKAHPWFNLIKPKLKLSLQPNIHKIPVDNNILQEVKNMGYDIIKVKESILKNKYDSLSAVYYLILKQFKRKGINSISDLYSQEFIDYLKNYKNWIDLTKINDPLYKDYDVDFPTNLEQSDFYDFGNSNSNYISVNKSEKFEDFEEKNFENYINSDKIINDMEIKFNNSNIFGDFDDDSFEENKESDTNNKGKNIYSNRNSKSNYFQDLVSMNSTDSGEISKRKKEFEIKKYNSNSTNNLHIYVNKKHKEKIILLNGELSQNNKEKIVTKLKNEEEKFNSDLKALNKIKNDFAFDNNIIKIIAEKLINTTIFNKYLLHNKKSKSFLENKFYILQKYKNIIGLIESMRNKIFTKKLNDFNFYTFNEYLNDDNDKMFVKSLIDIPYFNKFIKQAKDTLYKKDFLDKRTFSKYYDLKENKFNNNLSSKKLYSSYSNNFFGFNSNNINKKKVMAFTPHRNIKYININTRYSHSINRYDINNYKNTPYKYRKILKTPKSTKQLHYYQNKSNNKFKKYKSAGKLNKINNNPINQRFNSYKNLYENREKESASSYSNDSKDKKIKKLLYNNNENYYNINTGIESTSKKLNNIIYNSPSSRNKKYIAISPYKRSNKKISVQLLSDKKERESNLKKENNKLNYALKELKDFIPINLNCILINKSPNKIISKAKKFLMKKGYFCSNKMNEFIIKAIKGSSNIEINLYKLKYLNNIDNVYLSVKIKNKNLPQEKNLMNKLINYINEDKI